MNNCKICGKQPKIKYRDNACIVICKPLFKHTHYFVEAPTLEKAAKYWNERN